MSEDRVETLLRQETPPGEAEAEERAWEVVRAAHAQRLPAPRRSRTWRITLAAAAAIGALAVALTPAGAKVTHWIEDTIIPGHTEELAPLTSLPARGNLLVGSQAGLWVVHEDGSRRLLGEYRAGAWSPFGRYIAATDGDQLVAMEPDGDVRWSISGSRIADASWVGDAVSTRIAYRSGEALRVIAGDGTDDRALVDRVAPVAPVWQPAPSGLTLKPTTVGLAPYRLTYVDRRGRITLDDAESGRTLWRSRPGPVPDEIAWAPDGRDLVTVRDDQVSFLRGFGLLRGGPTQSARQRGEVVATAMGPPGAGFAVAVSVGDHAAPRSEVRVVDLDGRVERRVFEGPGEVAGLSWSPDGRWLLVAWRDADQWLFLPEGRAARSRSSYAVGQIIDQFNPGERGVTAFPRLGGWCCSAER